MDLGAVYRAVAASAAADEVRGIIAGYPSDEARLDAVNYAIEPSSGEGSDEGSDGGSGSNTHGGYQADSFPDEDYPGEGDETPLQSALRQDRGDLVAVLLQAGARAAPLFEDGCCNAVALSIYYGLPDTLRVLLQRHGHHADDNLEYRAGGPLAGSPSAECRAVHLCVLPPRYDEREFIPPRLACLRVLVREFWADVNARDGDGAAPLHCVAEVETSREDQLQTLETLLSLGADINALDGHHKPCLSEHADRGNLAVVRRLLDRGASTSIFDARGFTPLMYACWLAGPCRYDGEAVLALLRASSDETRRVVSVFGQGTAADLLVVSRQMEGWRERALAELLASGASILPGNAPFVLRIAARIAERRVAEADARARQPMPVLEQEEVAGLAMDHQELREAEKRVSEKEARVKELEAQLRARGEEEEKEEEGGSGLSAGGGGSGSAGGSGRDSKGGSGSTGLSGSEEDEGGGSW